MTDDWYKHAVFYELYPRAFCDSNGDGKGDFQGILSKVDYLAELGVDCVWLLPYYPSPLFDDGYDIADYYHIHPDFGSVEDLKRLIDALHERGIHVIADLVMNHTSDQHPWFVESRSSLDNPKRDWYVWSDTKDRYQDVRIIFIDTEESNWAYDESTGQYYWHRFYSQQPDLNFDNPEVQQEMLKIMDFWLELGLDGFRAAAVPYLFERENTICENLPETHDFLKEIRRHMNTKWHGKVLLAEANQWPEETREYFGDGDEFHMGFHFPIMPRLFMSLKKADRTSIVDIMERTPEIPPSCQWCVFLRNHDELTLEMVTPEERDYMWEQYAPEDRMRLNLGIRRRLAPLLDNDRRRIELMNALLFSLPGSPIIYYGDEIGMGDNIWLNDRDGVRTPMQWNSGHNAGFSDADPEKLKAPVIDDDRFSYQKVNVEAQRHDPDSLFNKIRHMIAVRRQHPVFGAGEFEFNLPDNKAVLAYWRAYQREKVLVVVNLSDEEQTAVFRLGLFSGHEPVDLLSEQRLPEIVGRHYEIILQPCAYFWLAV